jgi:hypothetical protein
MDHLIINKLKFYALDEENEIEIEKEGWSTWISIEDAQKLIKFLENQLETFKSE